MSIIQNACFDSFAAVGAARNHERSESLRLGASARAASGKKKEIFAAIKKPPRASTRGAWGGESRASSAKSAAEPPQA